MSSEVAIPLTQHSRHLTWLHFHHQKILISNMASAGGSSSAEERFLEWLRENGATFPKIQWPVLTPNGLRGAVALAPIATNEVMVAIPQRLMISEATCWADEQLRSVYEQNRDVFSRDDPVLALFLMRELARGDASFYKPYLDILPEVETVQDWSPAELMELKDPSLVDAAARRTTEMKAFYSKIMRRLESKYPGEFPATEYSYPRFRFVWKSIQARTFGRRLPWTSLVPFADCLNHTNVATKYDFDVDSNGTFRLYPSATNSYEQGSEVFNSYGRRPNFQLLLDYGFALEDNEWEFLELELPRDTAQVIGKRFPFRKRLRIETFTTLDALFPTSVFPETPTSVSETDDSPLVGDDAPRRDVLEWFCVLVEDALLQFETTVEKDRTRLVDDRLPERMRMAIVYRLGRMQLLERLLREMDEELRDRETSKDAQGVERLDDTTTTTSITQRLHAVHVE